MKLITAIPKPFKFEEARSAVSGPGLGGMTVTAVQGYGRRKGHSEIHRGAEHAVAFLPKIEIEVVVPGSQVSKARATIKRTAKTGQIGDGKMVISPIEHTIRIRTGAADGNAL